MAKALALKLVRCCDAVSICIPEHWTAKPDERENGFWLCYEEGTDISTIWIKVDRCPLPEGARGNPEFLRFVVEQTKERMEPEYSKLLHSEIFETGDGFVWKYTYDVETDGGERHFRHMFVHSGDEEFSYTDINFVILISAMEDPAHRALAEFMEREIPNARIEPFKTVHGGRIYNELKLANFADLLTINWPDTLRVNSCDGPAAQWYCYFEDRTVKASMYVMISDHRIKDIGFGVPRTGEDYEQSAEKFVNTEHEVSFSPMPGGILASSTYDDGDELDQDEPGDPSDWRSNGLTNHLWQYFHFTEDRMRQVQLLLMVPLGESRTPESALLIALWDREIRRARIPDMPAPGVA